MSSSTHDQEEPEALPLVGPDNKLHEARADPRERAVEKWLRWAFAALKRIETRYELRAWRDDNAPHFRSIANFYPNAVATVETAVSRRGREIDAKAAEETARLEAAR